MCNGLNIDYYKTINIKIALIIDCELRRLNSYIDVLHDTHHTLDEWKKELYILLALKKWRFLRYAEPPTEASECLTMLRMSS